MNKEKEERKGREPSAEPMLMARPLAPEDVSAGQYVCLTHTVSEYLPWWCLEERYGGSPEPIRMVWLPGDAGTPLRVIEVCVPFLLVEQPGGAHRMLDLRRHRIARISDRFGQRAFKRLRRTMERKEVS